MARRRRETVWAVAPDEVVSTVRNVLMLSGVELVDANGPYVVAEFQNEKGYYGVRVLRVVRQWGANGNPNMVSVKWRFDLDYGDAYANAIKLVLRTIAGCLNASITRDVLYALADDGWQHAWHSMEFVVSNRSERLSERYQARNKVRIVRRERGEWRFNTTDGVGGLSVGW